MENEVILVFELIFTAINALGTVALAIIGFSQLSKMNRTISDSNLMSNFEIEFELNRRKELLSSCRKENELFAAQVKTEEDKEKFASMNRYYMEKLEDYLNIFDRLCYYIRKGQINDDDFRIEYRDMLSQTIREFPELFVDGSQYRNMKKLNDTWHEI